MARMIHTVPTSQIGQLIGTQKIVNVPQPATATDWTYTLPGGYFYRLLAGTFVFTASAVASNRISMTQVTDGVNVLFRTGNNAAQVASTTNYWTIAVGVSGSIAVQNAGSTVSPFAPVWMHPSYVIQSFSTNLQAGDQFSQIVLWLEQLDYGAYGMPEMLHPLTLAEQYSTAPAS